MNDQPLPFAQTLVPQYIRVSLEAYPSLTTPELLVDSLSVILRRMPNPVSMLVIRKISSRVQQVLSPSGMCFIIH